MATFKTNSIDISFSYHDVNEGGYIEYTCDLQINGERLFNPSFYGNVSKGFVFSLDKQNDVLIDFFVDLFKTRKGNEVNDGFEELFSLKAETWLDKKEETMKKWKSKTVWTGNENTLKQEDYTSVMNELFVPILENQMKLSLNFSPALLPFFHGQNKASNILLIAETNFDNLGLFTADLIEEQKEFLRIYKQKISLLRERGII
jgi:hypothetical protein